MRRRPRFSVILSFGLVFLTAYIISTNIHRLNEQVDDKQLIALGKMTEEEKRMKWILFWNNFFDVGRFFSKKPTQQVLIEAGCKVTQCTFIDDVELFDQSDVVLFFVQYLRDIPSYRFPHQQFVFYQMEAPENEMPSTVLFNNKTRYGFFNRTMTYRRDSDIVNFELHGKSKVTSSIENVNLSYIQKNKKKLIAWFASHCKTSARREDYVNQLRKFIAVDVYGECGNLTCSTDHWRDCFEIIRNDYKFYLSFENSFCPDYVTEKLYRPLYYDTVPIVMGGADYDFYAPPNSFINVKDFKLPKHLAEYLIRLDQSDVLYERYFGWKKEFEIELNPMDGWCDLCQMAHDPRPPFKVYQDIKKWWLDDSRCHKGLPENVA